MNIGTHAISLYHVKATRTSIKELLLLIKPFDIVMYAFWKQLYAVCEEVRRV